MIQGWELSAAHFVGGTAETAARTDSYMPKHLGQAEGGKGHPCPQPVVG